MNIQEKLFYIQQNLKAPKSQYNKFGDFHYRSCEDIQEAVKPILKEVKAVLLISDEVIQIGNRFYIKATAALQDIESNEHIANIAYARETEEKPKMDVAQITGSCSSYARKYALNGLFCIDDAKDPDYLAEPTKRQEKPSERPRNNITQAEIGQLQREAARTGTNLATVCSRYKVAAVQQMTHEQYLRAMSAFKKMPTIPPPVPPEEQYSLDFSGCEDEMPFR